MTERKLPALGEKVFVWPRLRTVRDAQRNPVKDADGKVQKKPAYVRSGRGHLLKQREFVVVDLHCLKQISNGNLEWCDSASHREHLRKKTRAHAAAYKTAAKDAAVKKEIKKPQPDAGAAPATT